MIEEATQRECPIYLLKKRLWDTHDLFELCDLFECKPCVIEPRDFESVNDELVSMKDDIEIPF